MRSEAFPEPTRDLSSSSRYQSAFRIQVETSTGSEPPSIAKKQNDFGEIHAGTDFASSYLKISIYGHLAYYDTGESHSCMGQLIPDLLCSGFMMTDGLLKPSTVTESPFAANRPIRPVRTGPARTAATTALR